MSLLILFSSGNVCFNNAEVSKPLVSLGYTAYIPYPPAAAILPGLAAIWSNFSEKLKKRAYAGFFFDFALAVTAHLAVGDGEATAMMEIVLLNITYATGSKLSSANASG